MPVKRDTRTRHDVSVLNSHPYLTECDGQGEIIGTEMLLWASAIWTDLNQEKHPKPLALLILVVRTLPLEVSLD